MLSAETARQTTQHSEPSTQHAASCSRAAYYILSGQYGAALKQLEGAKSSGGTNADNENLRGLALLMSGKARPSLEAFDKALALQPDLVEARFNRGIASLQLGNYAAASAEFETVVKNEETRLRATAAYHNALALDRAGKAGQAETWLDRAVSLDPSLDAALLYAGALRERRGALEDAAKNYLAYLKRHPDSPVALLRLGVAANRAGRNDVAVAYLRKVIEKAPQSREATEARKFLVMWE